MGAMVATAAVSAVGAYASNRAKRKADERAADQQMAMTAEEARWGMERTAHEMALEDYYNRRDRWETQRGLDQFRQFSTVREFMPNFQDTSPRIENPTMPQIGDFHTGDSASTTPAPTTGSSSAAGSGVTTTTSTPTQAMGIAGRLIPEPVWPPKV